jgi:acetate---CoA ligase (ADP-forming)
VLGNADEVDALFVIFIPTGTTAIDDVAKALVAAKAELPPEVPVVSVFMSATGMPACARRCRHPVVRVPRGGRRALGRVSDYARWRRRPLGEIVEPGGIDREAARRIVDRVLEGAVRTVGRPRACGRDAGRWCSTEEATAILDAYGITSARSGFVSTADEGAALQREWGVPVAVKVAAAIHKADVGGLALDLRSGAAVAEAIGSIERSLHQHDLAEHSGRYLVQEMISDGIEMVVGVTHDPSFGPIIVTGMGGTLVELLRDVAVRITPVTDQDVAEMLDGLRMAPLLRGYRGAAPADVPALTDLIHRVNAMVEDLPEVAELDLNPVFVRPDGQGVVAVDVRLRLAPTARPAR